MKTFERVLTVVFLLLATVSLCMCILSLIYKWPFAGRWLSSAGLLVTISGLFQLEISGLIDKLVQKYGDETKYPYGPPSSITRQIIDNPDAPVRMFFRNTMFFNLKTGFWFIVLGTALQVVGAWL